MKLNRYQLIDKALAAGWQHSSDQQPVLWRKVPNKTRETYYTGIIPNNDSVTEFIAISNLQFCGKNNRVWKKMNSK